MELAHRLVILRMTIKVIVEADGNGVGELPAVLDFYKTRKHSESIPHSHQ
jgi:hypothetical protein